MPDDSKKDNYKKQYKKERDIEKIKYLQTGDLNLKEKSKPIGLLF